MQIKAYYSTQTSIDVCKLLGFTNYYCLFFLNRYKKTTNHTNLTLCRNNCIRLVRVISGFISLSCNQLTAYLLNCGNRYALLTSLYLLISS